MEMRVMFVLSESFYHAAGSKTRDGIPEQLRTTASYTRNLAIVRISEKSRWLLRDVCDMVRSPETNDSTLSIAVLK